MLYELIAPVRIYSRQFSLHNSAATPHIENQIVAPMLVMTFLFEVEIGTFVFDALILNVATGQILGLEF